MGNVQSENKPGATVESTTERAKNDVPMKELKSKIDSIPWKAGSTVAVVLGGAALYGYSLSIDYLPPDLLALVGLGSIAAVLFVAIWLGLTVVMFGTVAAVTAYEVERLHWTTVMLGQGSVLCFLFAWALRRSDGIWLVPAVLGAAAVIWTMYLLISERPRRKPGEVFLAASAVFLGGVLVVYGLVLFFAGTGIFTQPTNGWSDWRVWVVPTLLALLIAGNAFFVTAKSRLNPIAIWLVCAVATGLAFVILSGPTYIGGLLATGVGVKLPGVSTISVSKETCTRIAQLTQMPPPHLDTRTIPACSETVNLVRADVQMRWGGRWLLLMKSINGEDISLDAPRVVIPDEGTHLVLPAKR